MNINERLTYYTKSVLGKTQRQVSADTGLSVGAINRVFNNSQEPGAKVVNAFIRAYPELDLNWIYYGNGNIGVPHNEKKPDEMNNDLYNYHALVRRVEEISEEVNDLREELRAWKEAQGIKQEGESPP